MAIGYQMAAVAATLEICWSTQATTERGDEMDWNYTMRCDWCGRFMRQESGSSWVNVPAIDVPGHSYGDERERCAKCTKKHGPAVCSSAYVKELCCGVIP